MIEAGAAELKKVKIEVPGPDGANPEIFWGEGATEAEAYNVAALKVAEGKAHATAKIREQQQQLEEMQARLATPAAEPSPTNGFDREAYFSTLYADPLKAFDVAFEARFGMSPEEATSQWGSLTASAQELDAIKIANKWKLRHPELMETPHDVTIFNANAIEKQLTENELPYTEKGLEAAYALALAQGKLKLPAVGGETAPPSPPATLTNNGNGGDNVDEATLLAPMTLEQKRQYYSAKIAKLRQGQ